MQYEGKIIRIDKETGLVGFAEKEAYGNSWKLVPIDHADENRIELSRLEEGLRPFCDDDRVYEVNITYKVEDDDYGSFPVILAADNDAHLEKLIHKIAGESMYDDARIPDRYFEFTYSELGNYIEELISGTAISSPKP